MRHAVPSRNSPWCGVAAISPNPVVQPVDPDPHEVGAGLEVLNPCPLEELVRRQADLRGNRLGGFVGEAVDTRLEGLEIGNLSLELRGLLEELLLGFALLAPALLRLLAGLALGVLA